MGKILRAGFIAMILCLMPVVASAEVDLVFPDGDINVSERLSYSGKYMGTTFCEESIVQVSRDEHVLVGFLSPCASLLSPTTSELENGVTAAVGAGLVHLPDLYTGVVWQYVVPMGNVQAASTVLVTFDVRGVIGSVLGMGGQIVSDVMSLGESE